MQVPTRCAICGTYENALLVYPATVDEASFSVEIFSARRMPDRKHYQWVRCLTCDLYRSDPVSTVNLSDLYEKSTFDYSAELHGLKNSYSRIVRKSVGEPKGKSIMEIGGGNGFFLEEALRMGFSNIVEIEPSKHAYESADPKIKKYFIRDTLKAGILDSNSRDLVVAFHVLDHLQDPNNALTTMRAILKPGGVACLAVHNVNSLSARLLKSKSPIFDVEHMYLYSKSTLKALLEKNGFSNVKVRHYRNSYSIAYLFHLLPISRRLKSFILNGQFGEMLRKIRVTVPLGNMWAYAEK